MGFRLPVLALVLEFVAEKGQEELPDLRAELFKGARVHIASEDDEKTFCVSGMNVLKVVY